MTDSPATPRLYNKADSFSAMTGAGEAGPELLSRIGALAAHLDSVEDPYRRSILDRACRALLGQRGEDEPEFTLRPHITAELARISDDELPRYLFYRYRYDVFPTSRELDAFPPCVQIEPTSICNYRCVFCYQVDKSFSHAREGHMGQMPIHVFKQVIDQLAGNVEAVTLASRGEPLLCKAIEEMLAYVGGKFLGLKINTNAWFLDEAKAHAILAADPNTLVFSADAADSELYAKLRVGGQLERVVENIRRFAEIKARHYPRSRTIVRVSGVRYSDDQNFSAVEAFWREMVDQVAFVDYNPWENSYEVGPNGVTTPCSDLWRRTFVWWDGKVNPCDVDYRSTLSVGTAAEASLSEIWTGLDYRRLRDAHCTGGRQNLSPCRGCVLV